VDVVSNHIVSRLELLHFGVDQSSSNRDPKPAEVEAFCNLAMSARDSAAIDFFIALHCKGHSLDALFVDLLEPAARHLGDLWDQDVCDSTDVALGIARIQELIGMFGADDSAPRRDNSHRALLISPLSEAHVLGIDVAASFLRASGWSVRVEKGLDPVTCATAVATEWIGVVGLTLTGENGLEALARSIDEMRRASVNPTLGVMVGGRVFNSNPERAARVGADVVALDAATASITAARLLSVQSR
jgi:methylmalonyl-CoA mutase cobalamin-binding subunit